MITDEKSQIVADKGCVERLRSLFRLLLVGYVLNDD